MPTEEHWIDSHCHLQYLSSDEYDRVKLQDSTHMVCVSVCGDDAKPFKNDPNVLGYSMGIHPLHCHEVPIDWLSKAHWSDPCCIAVGETGLDAFKNQNFQIQMDYFLEHIHVARLHQKPLIMHSRSAAKETLAVIQSEHLGDIGLVWHCFTETADIAKKAIDLGCYLSFSGIITFQRAHELRQAAQYAPLESILIETDAPYLAPQPHRGQKNMPFYVKYVGEALAHIRSCDIHQIRAATIENTKKVFKKIS